MPSTAPPPFDAARELMLSDAHALSRGQSISEQRRSQSRARRAARDAMSLQTAGGDDELPIAEHRDAIIDALKTERVIVVSGETGSGKTTQLPRYALAAGFGRRAMIGHTQPRRIAARSVASRIAELCGTELGHGIGYAVRFDDRSRADTLVRVMTDGILLNAMQRDPLLLDYELIIIDEAHERSLNIDFLIGYLRRLLDRRDDLSVIITSATIDHERFAAHFGGAPVIEVSGRGYPVEVRYRDEAAPRDDSRALAREICDALGDVLTSALPAGAEDVLVFLPGEREIRDAERAIRKRFSGQDLETLPLYGRLGDQAQSRVFAAHRARRVVLATNVAETSITVPRIGAVIDSGLARISRYSHRNRVQRLGIEPVSQASANQRAGRCGRIGPGVCVRLYPERDFDGRPAFTDPEILRTNLASVVLQMATLGLGDPAEFPFLDAPEPGPIDDARRTLVELGAMDARRRITKLGRKLARLPLDPRLARMLLADTEPQRLAVVTAIVAGLSIQDPRLRPPEHAAQADDAHAAFAVPGSDFLTLYALWSAAERQRKASSNREFERWCEGRFLSARRMREWREVFNQLAKLVGSDWRHLPPVESLDDETVERLHQAILSGLLALIGHHDVNGEYAGAAGKRFYIHPSSVLAGRTPRWIMALEIVQTHRRMARYAAGIDSRWLPKLAAHLVDYEYAEPYWNARKGRVEAKRTTLLFGLVVQAGRRVDFAPVDSARARAVFLRDGLAADRVRLDADFLVHNRGVFEAVRDLVGRLRRRVEIGADQIAAWYGERLPETVVDRRSLARWWRKATADERAALKLSVDDLVSEPADAQALAAMPAEVELAGNRLPVAYRFAPDSDDDGAVIEVPASLLPALNSERVQASIPALLAGRVEARLRALPKADRRRLHPIRDTAAALAARLRVSAVDGSLDARLSAMLATEFQVSVGPDAWASLVEADFLMPTIRVVDRRGKTVAEGRDLDALKRGQRGQGAGRRAPAPTPDADSKPRRDWRFDALRRERTVTEGEVTLTVYPALQRKGSGVIEHEFLDPLEAHRAHDEAVLALLEFRYVQQLKAIRKALLAKREIQLLWAAQPDSGGQALVEDVQRAALKRSFGEHFGDLRTREDWQALCERHAHRLVSDGEAVIETLLEVLRAEARCREALAGAPDHVGEAADDVRAHIARLVYPGFLAATPADRVDDLARYLEADRIRLERVASNVARDAASMAMLASLEARMAAFDRVVPTLAQREAIDAFRWQLEELRVSLFAQVLGTREKVSAKRLEKRWDEILRLPGD